MNSFKFPRNLLRGQSTTIRLIVCWISRAGSSFRRRLYVSRPHLPTPDLNRLRVIRSWRESEKPANSMPGLKINSSISMSVTVFHSLYRSIVSLKSERTRVFSANHCRCNRALEVAFIVRDGIELIVLSIFPIIFTPGASFLLTFGVTIFDKTGNHGC